MDYRRTWADGYLWADIKDWPLTHLMYVDRELFECGYEANLEAIYDPRLTLRVARLWKLSQATSAELERRRNERIAQRFEVEQGHSPLLHGPNALLRAVAPR